MAIALLEEIQGLVAFAVPDPVSWVVVPIQAFKAPVIVGNVTVTIAIISHPLLFL
ncbi:hypothetical protein [Flavobacterium psychrophilum]|uniref:hypothetical protein n=1 Tax=Flavobacterium psychrophilum TaxID=96345 RepID=UPI00211B16A9|nr:hypothetical protein [Flavobacterium psychrophilum]